VWREIDLPLMSRAALVGASFAFVISLGEFGATSFIARPNTATIPTTIFRLLSRPGQASFGMAMALSVVLAVLTAAVVLGIEKTRVGDIGRF
jgi:thiamine transport system permease protein